MIEKFYRYDSGNKVFKELPGIKGFTLTTDAVALHKKYNQKVSNNILYWLINVKFMNLNNL